MPEISLRRGLLGISPVVVFLLLYLVVSLCVGDFYAMPFTVALMVAVAWSVIISRGTLASRIEVLSRAAAHPNIIYMVWIFILAGAFAALSKQIGAVDATVALALNNLPPQLIVPGLFASACFISMAIGTSVGTVVALTPLAAQVAAEGGCSAAFMVAVVLGGAFFGDNLSFISDTTIAATRSQGCNMADKFRANVWLAVPAAAVTMCIYIFMSPVSGNIQAVAASPGPVWLILPYLIVIGTAIARLNVTVVLTAGIISALVLGFIKGFAPLQMCGFMGQGIEGMGELVVITLLSAGMVGMVKALGGITWLLQAMTKRVHSARAAKGVIALLVGVVNTCTANNTVAIITVGSVSRDISRRFFIPARQTASILDSCSCIVQCLIPYGAQTLLATQIAGLRPDEPFRFLYYPWALAVVVSISLLIRPVARGQEGQG